MERCQYVDPLLMEPELSEDERKLRQAFVKAYMHSRDPVEACLAIGFLSAYAVDWANSFMSDSYVRRLIIIEETREETEEDRILRARKYRAMLEREASYQGRGSSHGARVSALASLLKMDEDKDDTGSGFDGGVMIVESIADPDTWGQRAIESQALLKQQVRD